MLQPICVRKAQTNNLNQSSNRIGRLHESKPAYHYILRSYIQILVCHFTYTDYVRWPGQVNVPHRAAVLRERDIEHPAGGLERNIPARYLP